MGSTPDTRTTTEIYKEAAETNDQVTKQLKGALRIVDDTRDVQAVTLSEMKKQGEQLGEIQEALDDVHEDTTYAQAVLDDIGCLCWCFGTKKSNKMTRPVHRQHYTPPSKSSPTSKPSGAAAMSRADGEVEMSTQQNGSTSKSSPDDPVLQRIEDGKKEQDDIMDQISSGLDVLAKGAKAMGQELVAQDEILENTEKQTDDVTQKTKETAHHTAFRRHVRNY